MVYMRAGEAVLLEFLEHLGTRAWLVWQATPAMKGGATVRAVR